MSGSHPLTLPSPPGDPTRLKCSCAELWAHPAAQLLTGPALRPGGTGLTERLLDRALLRRGDRVLDVGAGTGATLELLSLRGLRAVGVDYSSTLALQATGAGSVAVGDAEMLPYATHGFDGVLMECVLSVLPDKGAALAEVRRVLVPGGRLALSDVTVDALLPEPLGSVAGWMACAAGALPAHDHPALLERRGFSIDHVEDASAALAGFVDQVRRRVALLWGALGVGLVDDADGRVSASLAGFGERSDLAGLGDAVFAQLRQAIDRGDIGYTAIIARARA